jgi:hypothetical protein
MKVLHVFATIRVACGNDDSDEEILADVNEKLGVSVATFVFETDTQVDDSCIAIVHLEGSGPDVTRALNRAAELAGDVPSVPSPGA